MSHSHRLQRQLDKAGLSADQVPNLEAWGRFLSSVETCFDQRRAAARKLERYVAMLNASDDLVSLIDRDGTYLAVNDAYLRARDLELAQVVGRSIHDVWGELIRDTPVIEALEGCFAGKQRRYTASFEIARGSARHMDVSYYPHRDAGGEVTHAVVISRDITESTRTADELDIQKDFASQVVNAMGQGLTVTDARGRLEYVNPALATMLGYPQDQLIGKSPFEITHPDSLATVREHRVLQLDGKSTSYEIKLVGPDGRVVPVLVTSVPRSKRGLAEGSIAVLTDMSQHLEFDLDFVSAQAAEEDERREADERATP